MSRDPAACFQTSRLLNASPQTVYEAFAQPQQLAAWWGPRGFSNEFSAFDFREGGAWSFVMVGPDGKRYANDNRFERLVPGECVVIRHDCAPHFTLTVTLTSAPGGTQLHWSQAFDDPAVATAVKAIVVPANEQNLDRLAAVLSGVART